MENQLQKYFGRDDLKKSIASLEVIQGKAKDSGNIYYALDIKFINGFSKRLFPQDAEKFAITNAFELIPVQEQVDAF